MTTQGAARARAHHRDSRSGDGAPRRRLGRRVRQRPVQQRRRRLDMIGAPKASNCAQCRNKAAERKECRVCTGKGKVVGRRPSLRAASSRANRKEKSTQRRCCPSYAATFATLVRSTACGRALDGPPRCEGLAPRCAVFRDEGAVRTRAQHGSKRRIFRRRKGEKTRVHDRDRGCEDPLRLESCIARGSTRCTRTSAWPRRRCRPTGPECLFSCTARARATA